VYELVYGAAVLCFDGICLNCHYFVRKPLSPSMELETDVRIAGRLP
jgi:hypothetical protein